MCLTVPDTRETSMMLDRGYTCPQQDGWWIQKGQTGIVRAYFDGGDTTAPGATIIVEDRDGGLAWQADLILPPQQLLLTNLTLAERQAMCLAQRPPEPRHARTQPATHARPWRAAWGRPGARLWQTRGDGL